MVMKPTSMWPLPTILRVVALRTSKLAAGSGLVFEVDVTDGLRVATWRFTGVTLVADRPAVVDEDGPTLRRQRGEVPS